jgi:hypothetical protein
MSDLDATITRLRRRAQQRAGESWERTGGVIFRGDVGEPIGEFHDIDDAVLVIDALDAIPALLDALAASEAEVARLRDIERGAHAPEVTRG